MDDASQNQPQVASYAETPELHERIDRIGFGLLAGATVTFFLGFVFAYFYLRSLNNNGLWRPAGVEPPSGYGIVIAAAFVLSAVAFYYAARAARNDRGWVTASGIALVLGLFGCAAQAFEYAHIPFGPGSGGYASVFFGWTALYVVVALLAIYRVETVFASGLRNRGQETVAIPEGFVPAALYWALLAAIGLLAWILLYLI
jgi:heme/copper-type cytochrome/quinol oxidase subunit 3